MTTRSCSLEPDGSAARRARRFVEELCAHIGCSEALEDALVVVSEMVTNAVIHAATPSELRLRYADGVLRIEVADGNPDRPRRHRAHGDDESGRGLLLIETLSRAWGCEPTGAGKIVWAELAAATAS